MKTLLLFILISLTTNKLIGQLPNSVFSSFFIKKMPYVDPELRQGVAMYIWDMSLHGIDISVIEKVDSIIFVPVNRIICFDTFNLVIGCAYGNKILIKKNWDYYFNPNAYIRVILYHEMGHGVLGLPHAMFINSIMNPELYPSQLYINDWDYFHKQYINYYYFCKKYGFSIK